MLNDCKGKEHAKEQLAVIRGSQSKKKHTIITMIQSLQKLLYRRSRGKIQSYVKASNSSCEISLVLCSREDKLCYNVIKYEV